jgi:hypothetical protein
VAYGIYVVFLNIAKDQQATAMNQRLVIVAESALEAEQIALNFEWPTMTELGRKDNRWRTEVGRIGTYDPGITGAAITQDVVVAIERWDERLSRSPERLMEEAFIHKAHMHDTEGKGDTGAW